MGLSLESLQCLEQHSARVGLPKLPGRVSPRGLIIKLPDSAASTVCRGEGPPVDGEAVNEAAGHRAGDAMAPIQPWLGTQQVACS